MPGRIYDCQPQITPRVCRYKWHLLMDAFRKILLQPLSSCGIGFFATAGKRFGEKPTVELVGIKAIIKTVSLLSRHMTSPSGNDVALYRVRYKLRLSKLIQSRIKRLIDRFRSRFDSVCFINPLGVTRDCVLVREMTQTFHINCSSIYKRRII